MSDVTCSSSLILGTPTSLQDCDFSVFSDVCSHSTDVGLRCSTCDRYLCADGQCTNAVECDGVRECNDGSDEENLGCSVSSWFYVPLPPPSPAVISQGLSRVVKIGIGVGVFILVLLIAIPTIIIVSVCVCTGACISCATSRNSRPPEGQASVITTYHPAPAITYHPAPTTTYYPAPTTTYHPAPKKMVPVVNM